MFLLSSPEDVVGLTDWPPFVHASRYRRRALSMEWEGAESHAHTATTDGEYCLVEAHAVPFYLQHIFADRYGLFEVVTVPLRLLEILLEHLEEFMQQQATAGPDDSTSFRNFLQQAHNKKIPRMRFELRYAAEKEYKAVVTLLTHLEESEVCVVPSVLLLNKEHTANEWSADSTLPSLPRTVALQLLSALFRRLCAQVCHAAIARDRYPLRSRSVPAHRRRTEDGKQGQ